MNNEPHQNEVRRLLSRLPDAPVASNFTARAMRAIELEDAKMTRARFRNPLWFWRVLAPRAAIASVIVGFTFLTYQRHELNQRTEFARNVAAQQLPSVEALKNFDVIRRMSQSAPRADKELLALLQ